MEEDGHELHIPMDVATLIKVFPHKIKKKDLKEIASEAPCTQRSQMRPQVQGHVKIKKWELFSWHLQPACCGGGRARARVFWFLFLFSRYKVIICALRCSRTIIRIIQIKKRNWESHFRIRLNEHFRVTAFDEFSSFLTSFVFYKDILIVFIPNY